MMPAAPKSTGSQRRLFEPPSGPASSASAATYVPALASAGAGAATPTCRGVASAAPFAASRVCSPVAIGSSSHDNRSSSSSSNNSSSRGSGVIAPVAALVLSKILDIVAAVNKRYRISARLDKAQKAALSALSALNAKTRGTADGLTLYDRLEALLCLCARRLGSLVSVAVQVERELAVGRWVSKRAGGLRGAVEPLLGAAVGGLRRLDEGVLGGRAGKAAARVLPAGFVGYLHWCGRDGCGDGDGYGDDDEVEDDGLIGWAGAREGRLALAASVTPQLTRVQVRGSGGGSGSSGGRCATARLVQTPIRALVFSPQSK